MSAFSIYLLTILPNLGTTLGILSGIGLGVGAILVIVALVCLEEGGGDPEDSDTRVGKSLMSSAKCIIFSGAIGVTLSTAIPSEKQMAIIVVGTYLTNSEWSKLPDDVASMLRKQLQEWSGNTDSKETK